MSTLYRARVVRIDVSGVYVEITELGEGAEWGPLELLSIGLDVGDPVLVGSINEINEDLALLGKLVSDPPVFTGDGILVFENATLRNAAIPSPTSGKATWLDDEQRLDIYTDEGIPGWISYFGVKFDQLLLPQSTKIGIGNTSPAAAYDCLAALSTDRYLGVSATGDTFGRFVVNASGICEWGSGSAARDTNLYRNAANVLKTDDSFVVGINLSVTGTSTLTGAVSTTGTLHVGTNLDVDGTFDVDGDSTFEDMSASGTLTVAGLVTAQTDLSITDDLTVGDAASVGGILTVTGDATVAGEVFVGPDVVDIGRGMINRVSSQTASSAIGATETVVMTFPSKTYRANRSYRIFHEANFTVSAASTAPSLSYGNFQVRKTDATGQILATFSRFALNNTSTQGSARATAVFTVGNADLTGVLVVTAQGTGTYNVVQFASNSPITPRVCSIYDVGPDTDFPDNPILV